jgi:hypothetical protein
MQSVAPVPDSTIVTIPSIPPYSKFGSERGGSSLYGREIYDMKVDIPSEWSARRKRAGELDYNNPREWVPGEIVSQEQMAKALDIVYRTPVGAVLRNIVKRMLITFTVGDDQVLADEFRRFWMAQTYQYAGEGMVYLVAWGFVPHMIHATPRMRAPQLHTIDPYAGYTYRTYRNINTQEVGVAACRPGGGFDPDVGIYVLHRPLLNGALTSIVAGAFHDWDLFLSRVYAMISKDRRMA